MATQAVITVQNIPLKNLTEDPDNPRTVFDGIDELAASIKQQGLLSPLTVRPSGKGYMIVAGARRFRAARTAKLLFAPCIVRNDLSEAAVREVQIVENLQRADIHPLDEAVALQKLLALHQGDGIAGIAAKIGRPEAYIKRRMALTNLIEEFRDLFRESKISKAHANLLCPLTAEEQQILYQQHFANKDYTGFNQYCQIPRPGELRRTIQRDFFLELGAAPFDTADPALVAAAGSCLDCPKRSGNSPALFVDMKATNTCTDPTCYKVKVDVYISQLAETTLAKTKKPLLRLSKHDHSKLEGVLKPSQWRRAKAGECELLRKGILVEEYYSDKKELYKTITVCIDKECPKHWGPDAAPSEDDPRGEQKVKDKAKMDKIKAVVAQRREVADALMEVALKPLDDFMLKEAAKKLYNRVEGAYRKQIASKWYDIEPRVTKTEWGTYKDVEGGMIATIEEMNTKELGQFITMCVVAPEALAGAGSYQYSDEKSWSKTTLNRIAEHYGLDPKKIKPEKKERK